MKIIKMFLVVGLLVQAIVAKSSGDMRESSGEFFVM